MNNGFGVLGLFVSFGYMIYGLFNQKKADRPEPQEVQCNSYVRNVPVPIMYGTNKIAGECIWLGNTRAEYVEPENGKGFGLFMPLFFSNKNQSENYGWFYYADFAIGLCEGPIIEIKTLFFNGDKLKSYWEYWDYTLYLGDGTQNIDPIVSEALDSNAIPWRHTANLIMSGSLGQVNYIPTIEAEISGLLTGDTASDFSCTLVYFQDFDGNKAIWYDEGYLVNSDPKQIDTDDNGNIYCYQSTFNSYFNVKYHRSIVSPLSNAGELEFHSWTTITTNIQIFCDNYYPGISGGSGYNCFQMGDYTAFPNYYYVYQDGGYYYQIWIHCINSSGEFINNIHIGAMSTDVVRCPITSKYSPPYCFFKYLGNDKWLVRLSSRILLAQEYLYHPIYLDTGFSELFTYVSNDYMDFLNHSDDTARDSSGNRLFYFYVLSVNNSTIKIYRYSNGLGLEHLLTSPHYYSNCSPIAIDYDEESNTYFWVMFLNIDYPEEYTSNGFLYFYLQEDLFYTLSIPSYYGSIIRVRAAAIKVFYDYVFYAFEVGFGLSYPSYRTHFLVYNKKNGQISEITVPLWEGGEISFGGSSFFIENNKLYFLNHEIELAGGFGVSNYIWQVCIFNPYDDPNPIKVVYDFMTNTRYGLGLSVDLFDGSPTTSGSWKTESDYCDENVEMEDGLLEKRFMFAAVFDQRKKAYDLIREVLQTCRGFLYYCDGKLKVKIEKGTEEPVFYFGNDEYSFLSSEKLGVVDLLQLTFGFSEFGINSLVVYNDKIYCGTGEHAKLFEWNGVNAWVEVAPQLSSDNTRIISLAVFNNKIYGGTYSGGNLFEWNGVNAWVQVAPTKNSQTEIHSLIVYNNKLYGSTGSGGRLFEWNGVNAWVQVAPKKNYNSNVYCLVIYNNKIYGGTGQFGSLFEWNGVNAWVQVAGKLGTETRIRCLAVFNNKIYGGTYPNGKLYEWNGVDAWVQVANTFSSSDLQIVSLIVYNNELYGCSNNGKLLKWNGVDAWEAVVSGGIVYSIIKNDVLYVSTYAYGYLYSLGERTYEIPINDITRPDDYWVGDIGYIYYTDDNGLSAKKEFIISDSSSTSITLYESIAMGFPKDSPVILIKDNMKKDSFQYNKKSEDDKINTIHLNYIERDDGNYRVDTLDLRNEYAIEQSGQIVEQSFDMYGIKRNTQARRMITFLDNFNSQINYECSFDTDLLGIMLCIGDIIGVTSDVMGWCGKLFRVSSMEEIEDLETKLTLLEYNSSIYGDDYIPAAESVYDLGEDFLNPPDKVLNLSVFEDSYVNKIWIAFSRPIEYRFWAGAIIYHYDPNQSSWIKLDISNTYTFTGELSSFITALSTTISFTSEYSFELLPSSGIIWIEEEMIYYGAIDEDTNSFLQCIRGYNDTVATAHSFGEICTLFRSTLFSYNYDIKNDIDKTHSFKAVSLSSFGVLANTDNAPSVDIDIEGRYNDFYPVSLLNFYMSGNDIVLRWFGRTHNKNTGYGGMSYGAMGYGEGFITDVREYRMDIYVSSVFVKTKTIAIPDKTDDPYLHTYTEAENLADNGVLSYPLFIVYQVDNYGNLSSEQSIQSAV